MLDAASPGKGNCPGLSFPQPVTSLGEQRVTGRGLLLLLQMTPLLPSLHSG